MLDQTNINIFHLIPGHFKKVGQTGGGEWHGACPFCGGKDRFAVWPQSDNGGRWWCRQCGRSGDSVGFLMEYKSLDFKAACEQLRIEVPDLKTGQQTPRAPQPEVWASDLKDAPCFEKEWQWKAETFADACAATLWYAWEGSAGQYLESRGITKEMAVVANLGLNRDGYHDTWGRAEVFLPRGITIPWEIEGQLYNVRVRRRNADLAARPDLSKYASSKGCANGMYGIGQLCPGDTVYLTEGEFDALVLRRWLNEHRVQATTVASIGATSGARVVRWITRLMLAKKILLTFDNDGKSDTAAQYWMGALHPKAGWLKPTQKDVTEMWQRGELPLWIGEGV